MVIGEETLVREPLYEKLKKRLLCYIETENLRMLPNEKELMARYGVSRNTLRRAILELTNDKVLQPIQGLGTIVYPVPQIVENSRILVAFDPDMGLFQQEVFNKLLLLLNNSRLNSNVIMLDKEHVDVARFEEVLKGCDGVIVDQLCSYSPVVIEQVRKTGKKLVCLRWKPDTDIPFVAEDVCAGFYFLARHLLELGHRDIVFIGHDDDIRRIPGIRRAFEEHKLDPSLLYCIHAEVGTRADGYRCTDALLKSGRRFTAILGNSDETALGIEERLLIAGKRIPEDVSVTGFDNLKESAVYPVPLTTCSGDMERIIHEVIAYLFSARNSGATLNKLIEPQLIARQSTGRVPIVHHNGM